MRYSNSGSKAKSAVGRGFGRSISSRSSGSKVGRPVARAAKGRSGLATRRAKSGKMALGRRR